MQGKNEDGYDRYKDEIKDS
jgi:fatty acyl-CoA reductase